MPAQRLAPSRTPQPSRNPFRTRVWTAGRLLVLMLALGITFGAFFLTALRVASRAREVAVPDIAGKSVTDATSLLGKSGLGLKVEMRRSDPTVPADHVLSQDPAPGSILRRQRDVRVRVSDGQRDPVVPSVIGQPDRTAEIVLAQDKIEIGGRVEVHTASYPAGTVIAQDPNESNRASKVTLLVNKGAAGATFVMPDTIGALGGRVIDILRRRGFRVTVTSEVPYPGLPPGVVVRQTPQPGFQVGYGDTVVLELSR